MRAILAMVLLPLFSVLPIQAQEGEGAEAGVPSPLSGSLALPPVSGALPEEAPSSLFVTENGPGVEFTINGSWKASLTSSPKISFGSLGTTFSFSGSPLLFSQAPDIFMRLVLDDSWFFEAAFSQALEDSTFAVGYEGGDGDFVKEIRAGNQGLKFKPRPFLDFGASGNKSFGIDAVFGSTNGDMPGYAAQAMVRFDSMDPEKVVYIGMERISETTIQAADFLSGRFFVLPDENITDIAVYTRCAAGIPDDGPEGFEYAKLDPSAYGFSLSRGTVSFEAALGERTLIAYERADSLPISAAETVLIDGRAAVVVFDPGERRDSEILSRYVLKGIEEGAARVEVSIESITAGNLDTSFGSGYSPGDSIIDVFMIGERDVRSASGRMPFQSIAPEIYEPAALPPGESPIKIKIIARVKKEKLEIDSKAIADTIRVRRNGAIETGFSYTPYSGYIELSRPPGDTEKIEIEYMCPSSQSPSSDFVAGLAFDYFFSDSLSAYAALGTRWSMPDGEVSDPDTMTAGSIGLSAGAEWKKDGWKASLDLGLSYYRQDANDMCRIDGMEDYIHTQKAADGTWLRSVLPPSLVEDRRADLVYRNFRRKDIFGNETLESLESGFSPDAADTDSAQGPYLVGDGLFGTASLAEFNLDAERNWCGVQAKFDQSLIDKLPQAKSIVIPLRYLHGSGAVPAFSLYAGMLGTSPYETSGEAPGLRDPRYLDDVALSGAPSTEWMEYEIPLDADLVSGIRRGASIMLVISSAGISSGRCLIGSLRLKGANYVKGGAARDYLSLEQRFTGGPESAYPDSIASWRGTTEGNAYLRIRLEGNSTRVPASAQKFFPLLPVRAYKKLVFHARYALSDFDAASVALELSDSAGAFLSASIPLGSESSWGRAEIDLDTGEGLFSRADGSSVPFRASVLRDMASDGASLRWICSGIENGYVDVDELGLSDSRSSMTGLVNFSASREKTGALLTIAGHELISGLEASVSSRLGIGSTSLDYSAQAQAGISVFPFVLSASTSVVGQAAQGTAPSWPVMKSGHRISLPFLFGSVESGFSYDTSTGYFGQKDSVKLSFPNIALGAEAQAVQDSVRLGQSWKGGVSAKVLSENLRAETAWSNEIISEETLLGSPYPVAWIDSYSFLLPTGLENSSKRGVNLGLSAVSEREGFANNRDFQAQALTTYQSGINPVQGSEASFSAAPLLRIGKNGMLRLIPEYSRKMSLSSKGNSYSYGEDLVFLSFTLARLPSLWKGIPILEFFDSKALGELRELPSDPDSAIQEAKAGLGMERDAIWGIGELFIPSRAAYSLARESKRLGSLSSESLTHSASLGIRAIDLFGAHGIHPLTRSFLNDEYGLDQKLKLTQNIVGAESGYQYSASLFCLFGIKENDELDIRNDLRFGSEHERFAESLIVSLSLTSLPGPGVESARRAILDWLSGHERKEGLKASSPLLETWMTDDMLRTVLMSAGTAMSLDDEGLFTLGLPVSCESSLSIERSIKLSAGAKLEFGWKKTATYSQFDLGLSLSIQARMEF